MGFFLGDPPLTPACVFLHVFAYFAQVSNFDSRRHALGGEIVHLTIIDLFIVFLTNFHIFFKGATWEEFESHMGSCENIWGPCEALGRYFGVYGVIWGAFETHRITTQFASCLPFDTKGKLCLLKVFKLVVDGFLPPGQMR